MITIAAVADIHFGSGAEGSLRPHLEELAGKVDLIAFPGDFTRHGTADEAEVFSREMEGIGLPVVAILGNHDYHSGEEKDIRSLLEGVGIVVLDGESHTFNVRGETVGVAGIKGFGGGFAGASGSEFGEPEMKAFIAHTRAHAERLRECLVDLDADRRLVLLHYAPVEATVMGERREIFPFLGSYLLAEAVDELGADLILHGHAHVGSERGTTPGGVPVRNVARAVIRRPYALYRLGAEDVD